MFESFDEYVRSLARSRGGLSAIREILRDIFYSTRFSHFFLYFLATAYGWAIATGIFPNPIAFIYNLAYALLFGGLDAFLLDEYYIGLTQLAFACVSNGLLFIAILMYNDYCDYGIDIEGRKKDTLLTRGIISKNEQLAVVLALMALITAMAYLVGPLFLLITFMGFFGLWIYSAKPFQTKRRAGLDLLSNGFHPWLITVSGALIGASSYREIPYLHFLCVGFMGMIIFALTCFMDLEDDRKNGVETICVKLGFTGSTILTAALIAGLFILVGLDSYFNYVFTLRWFWLSFPMILAGIVIILLGFFRWIFIWREKRCLPYPIRYRKVYKYLAVGVPLELFPFLLFIIDYSFHDLPWF